MAFFHVDLTNRPSWFRIWHLFCFPVASWPSKSLKIENFNFKRLLGLDYTNRPCWFRKWSSFSFSVTFLAVRKHWINKIFAIIYKYTIPSRRIKNREDTRPFVYTNYIESADGCRSINMSCIVVYWLMLLLGFIFHLKIRTRHFLLVCH